MQIDTVIKNYQLLIRNPKLNNFYARQFGKNAFINKNKSKYQGTINDLLIQFLDSKKVIIKNDLYDEMVKTSKEYSLEFNPFYHNQILIIEDVKGNVKETTNIGFWIRDKKDYYMISSFITLGEKFINCKVDWAISKKPDLFKKSLSDYSSSHHNNYKLYKDWFKDNDELFNFYCKYCKPFQHFSLKDPHENPYGNEIVFDTKEEMIVPLRIHHFVNFLNNMRDKDLIDERDPEERLADLKTKRPLGYQYKVLTIKRNNQSNYNYNRSVNKNRFHDVRGFYRKYKSGKKVWINSFSRGDKTLGIVEKEYKITNNHNKED